MTGSYESSPQPAAGDPVVGVPAAEPTGGIEQTSTKDVARDEARHVADDAKARGRDVTESAKSEAGEVVAEAKAQAQNLVSLLRDEVTGQSATQSRRAAGGMHSLAGELGAMADNGQNGMASDLVRQASSRLDGAASWVEAREPSEILDEVRRFARQKPGTFLAAAAAVGFLGGRLTSALRSKDDSGSADGATIRRTDLRSPRDSEYEVVREYRPEVPDTATAASGEPVDPNTDLAGPGYRPGERA